MDGLLVAAPLRIEARAVRSGLRGGAVVSVSGMGPDRSRVWRAGGSGVFAVAGFCGGLGPGMRPGDIVVATDVHGPDGEVFACSGDLALLLRSAGFTVHHGSVATVDALVRGDQRRLLFDAGFLAADMESAHLLRTASRPSAVLRVVTDAPGHELLRPAIVPNGLRAYRNLSRAAAQLPLWAHNLIEERDGGR